MGNSNAETQLVDGQRAWPYWTPRAAVVWCVVCAVVQLAWVVTGTTVPWSPSVGYTPCALGGLAVLAVVAAGASLVVVRQSARWGGWLVPAVMTVAIPAFAAGMLPLPAHLVTLVAGAGVDSVTGFLHVVLHALALCVLVPTAIVHRRRTRGDCVRCGRRHRETGNGTLRHPAATAANRRTRVSVYLFLCGLLPWAVTKSVWTLGGDMLGVSAAGWQAVNEGHTPLVDALAAFGIDVTVLASALAALLPLALLHPWGQVLPRWVPFLGESRVPRLLLLLPVWGFGVGLALYGVVLVVYVSLSGLGALPAPAVTEPFTSPAGVTWMTLFGGLAFGGLGGGMLVGARSYGHRTHPWCDVSAQASFLAGR